MASDESYYPAFPGYARPHISIGLSFEHACLRHASETYKSARIYIVVSRTISKTVTFTKLNDILGSKVVGIRYGVRQHVPWEDVLELARDLRDTKADLIITLGAGSLTDGVKVASFACANSAFTLGDLDKLHISSSPKPDASKLQPCTIPVINIPTSLSGGEYTFGGGATNFRTGTKRSFQHPTIGSSLIILDPAITVDVPERVWLSSGMRAVDHCIEGLCSIYFQGPGEPDVKSRVENVLTKGLQLLLPSLLLTKQQPSDLEARRRSMLGVTEAMTGLKVGVAMGASHGIGNQLGPLGVGHGETSCVMLPSVLRYNLQQGESWISERQAKVLEIFRESPSVMGVMDTKASHIESPTLADVVAGFIKALGLPGTLSEVGIGSDVFSKLADNAMTDRWIPTNPVKITQTQQILHILQMASKG